MTAPAIPLPSTRAHLDALTATGGEGWLIVSALVAGKWKSASFTPGEVDRAAQWAARADAAGHNVYVRTNLLGRPLSHSGERGLAEDTGTAVALAVDLDVAGPGHKQGATKHPLPPDLRTATAIVADLPEPSMTIHTGGGAHLWWILDEPVIDDPVALLETWADRIVQAGADKGWHVDRPDAARVLRVCGTHRRKASVRPNLVTLEDVAGWPVDGMAARPWCPRGRYGARDLLEALPRPKAPAPPPAPTRQRRPGEVGPADAVDRLAWADILEPKHWTHAGQVTVNGEPVELWRRPGDPSSDYSIKCWTNGGMTVWSDATGLGPSKTAMSKWALFVALHHGGDEKAAGRAVRTVSREMAR